MRKVIVIIRVLFVQFVITRIVFYLISSFLNFDASIKYFHKKENIYIKIKENRKS